MKYRIWLLAICNLTFWGCQEVIEVDLAEPETRLVLNAVIRVDEAAEFVPVELQVAESSGFFGENTPAVLETAIISYGNPIEGDPTLLEEIFISSLAESFPGSGVYIPDPTFTEDQRIRTANIQSGTRFQLLLEYQGRSFFAQTTYVTAPPLDQVIQGEEILFDEDDVEVLVSFTDIPEEENFYVFDMGFNEFLPVEDQFFNGQQFEFSYFYNTDLMPDQEVTVSILGADLSFFNYMTLLVEQTQQNFGFFETPVATVRGNLSDVTGLDNTDLFDNLGRPQDFALGYFAVVQEFQQTIIIE